MIKYTICFILSWLLLTDSLPAQQVIPADQEVFYQKAMKMINPKHISWIKQTALAVNQNNLDENAIKIRATNYGKQNNMNDNDIMAVAFIVMMEASKSSEKDLKDIMEGVKKINKEKEGWRELNNQVNKYSIVSGGKEMPKTTLDSFKLITKYNPNKNIAVATQTVKVQSNQVQLARVNSAKQAASPAEIKQLQDDIKNKLDAANEMSEENALRLQMMMDRRSKFMSTLSNIMKKISDTQDGIISNLK